MTKIELAKKIAEENGLSKAAALRTLNSLVDGMTNALKQDGGKVMFAGLGTFLRYEKKEREGYSPQNGARITIQARTTVKFRPGKKLREELEG